ncbi:hypothetical protein GJAV_G00143480, partial [Gymnothorax javanicus]
ANWYSSLSAAEILQANDSLTQVINLYRQLVKGEEVNGESGALPRTTGGSTALLDLTGLDTSPPAPPSIPEFPPLGHSPQGVPQEMGISLLDDELMSLGLNDVAPNSSSAPQSADGSAWNTFQSSEGSEGDVLKPAVTTPAQAPPSSAPPGQNALEELDLLGKTLLQQSLPPESQQVKWSKQEHQSKPTLRDLQHKSNPNSGPSPTPTPAFSSEPPGPLLNPLPSLGASTLGPSLAPTPPSEIALTDVTVPLESIKPSSLLPVTVFDRHSLRVLFHFARDCPPLSP